MIKTKPKSGKEKELIVPENLPLITSQMILVSDGVVQRFSFINSTPPPGQKEFEEKQHEQFF